MKFKNALTTMILLCGLPVAAFGQTARTTVSLTPDGLAPGFQTLDVRSKNLFRADTNADWSAYKYVRFAPVAYEPVDPDHCLSARELAKVRAQLVKGLNAAFSKPQQGPGKVLLVTPVITDVKRTNSLANLVSFAAFQVVVSYGGATVRFELSDAATGEKIGEVSSERNARPWNVYPWNMLENFKSTGQSSVILKGDAKILRKDLQHLAKLQAVAAAAPVMAHGEE